MRKYFLIQALCLSAFVLAAFTVRAQDQAEDVPLVLPDDPIIPELSAPSTPKPAPATQASEAVPATPNNLGANPASTPSGTAAPAPASIPGKAALGGPAPSTLGQSTNLPTVGGDDTLQKIEPSAAPALDRSQEEEIPLSYGELFTKEMVWEAVPSSQAWRRRWQASDFGHLGVTTVRGGELGLDRGVPLPWKRDAQGFPEVILRTSLAFPNLQRLPLTDLDQPIEWTSVDIRQYISLFKKGNRWFAAASPFYITMSKGETNVVLVGIEEGKGAWSAYVGEGGLMVRDFVEAGLAAARTKLVRTFRDEEINWFLRGNSDVVFYLRTRPENNEETASALKISTRSLVTGSTNQKIQKGS